MQSWLPDDFGAGGATATIAAYESEPVEFDIGTLDGATPNGEDSEGRRFCRETGFTDGANLMAQMTRDERAQVFDLVEIDVSARFEKRAKALQAEQDQAVAQVRADYETRLRAWQEDFGATLKEQIAAELRAAAGAAARLAVQLAGKIVRTSVQQDPEILARAIETALFKIQESSPLDVTVNPDDAAWLADNEELHRKLNIGRIAADRRVEPGGCLVRSGGREWDATLTGQLDTLAELVEEMISTSGSRVDTEAAPEPDPTPDPEPTTDPEEQDDPGLE